MSRRTLLAALAAISLGVVGVAAAQEHDRRGGPDDRRGDVRGWNGPDRHPGRHGGPPGSVPPGHRYDNRSHGGGHRHDDRGHGGGRGYDDRGPGWHDHAFRHGERLPPGWRHRQYVVDDWRGHRLRPPPRGHQWVQVGGEYLLVAIPTGIIVQVVLGH